MDKAPYYYAALGLVAEVDVSQDEQERYRATLRTSGFETSLRSNQQMLAQITKRDVPNAPLHLIMSPRTEKDGTLRTLDLRLLREPGSDEGLLDGFEALGELVYVGEEDGRIGLRIYPNPRGQLKRPFTISMGLEPYLFNTLPRIGYGLKVTGTLDLTSRRLVVTRSETVPLPPKKPKSAYQHARQGARERTQPSGRSGEQKGAEPKPTSATPQSSAATPNTRSDNASTDEAATDQRKRRRVRVHRDDV